MTRVGFDDERADVIRVIGILGDGDGLENVPVLSLQLTVPRIDHLLRLIGLAQIARAVDGGFEYAEYLVPHTADGRPYLSYYSSGELRNDTPYEARAAIYEAVELGWGVVPFRYRVCADYQAPINPRVWADVESVAFLCDTDDEFAQPPRTQPLTEVVLRKLRAKLLSGSDT
jgi:hypothetical protein